MKGLGDGRKNVSRGECCLHHQIKRTEMLLEATKKGLFCSCLLEVKVFSSKAVLPFTPQR